MVEEKLALDCNQVTQSNEKDFEFSDDMTGKINDKGVKQYSRDLMLQLRLHPLSLQKPKDLADTGIVKDKLYLHQISDSGGATLEKHVEVNNFHSSSKSDYCSMKHDYSVLTPYFNKMHPYCLPSHMYSGAYQNSSKFRSPFHSYCNPLKKHSIMSHPCFKDVAVDECLWTKRCFASDDLWTCYPSHPHSNFTMKKIHAEAVPKSRKKLSIIDPVTGKNVLEAVSKSSSESNTSTVNENFKSSDECNTDLNRNNDANNYFCTKVDHDTLHASEVYDDAVPYSSDNKLHYERLKDADILYQADYSNDRTYEDNSKSGEPSEGCKLQSSAEGKREKLSYGKDALLISDCVPASEGNVNVLNASTENAHDGCDAHKYFSKQIPKTVQNNVETNQLPDAHVQPQKEKEHILHSCKESASQQTDSMKEGIKQLREKIYSLRQEQQKMTILQGFLRYKKYQLEETARSLDEKRIEIANWECNLYNKARRLQDREEWLESRSEMLFCKAQQLAEREKNLNPEESKVSNEFQPSKNIPCFSYKKFDFDNYSDAERKGKELRNNSRNEEPTENGYNDFVYCSNICKISESSPTNSEKYKSKASAMDEFEKNILLLKKINSSQEIGDSNVEMKPESVSSISIQKKNETIASASELIGYSKGRRYLPEHIKYWLNKRDKSIL